jgi:hypothetical protein
LVLARYQWRVAATEIYFYFSDCCVLKGSITRCYCTLCVTYSNIGSVELENDQTEPPNRDEAMKLKISDNTFYEAKILHILMNIHDISTLLHVSAVKRRNM